VRCHQYKGALLPEATDLARERRLLHPRMDDLAAHIREDERTGRLEGLTAMGRFHIVALRLNRPALVVHRQRRYLADLLEARLEQALAENKALRERIAYRELYITYLEERLTERGGSLSGEG